MVAAFAPWHEHHEVARRALTAAVLVPGPVITETYSVLTRLPAPFRMPAAVVADYLEGFAQRVVVLDSAGHLEAIARCASLGIDGGRTYDALIAVTAQKHDAALISMDRRAVLTYESLGCPFRLLPQR